jgi:hypothetical protein
LILKLFKTTSIAVIEKVFLQYTKKGEIKIKKKIIDVRKNISLSFWLLESTLFSRVLTTFPIDHATITGRRNLYKPQNIAPVNLNLTANKYS